jgi:type VI secretion system secreted protein Hcp
VTFAVLLLGTASAQADYYLQIDGISGESKDRAHSGWIDVLAFTQSAEVPDAQAAGMSRRAAATFRSLGITKEVDASSPKLLEAVAKGKAFKSATLHVTNAQRGAANVYYTIVLSNAVITSYSVSGDAGALPREQIAISFESVKVSYTRYDAKGKAAGQVEFVYNVATRK